MNCSIILRWFEVSSMEMIPGTPVIGWEYRN